MVYFFTFLAVKLLVFSLRMIDEYCNVVELRVFRVIGSYPNDFNSCNLLLIVLTAK